MRSLEPPSTKPVLKIRLKSPKMVRGNLLSSQVVYDQKPMKDYTQEQN
jgi:hypothetical protein